MTNHAARSRGPSPRRLGYGNPRPEEESHDPYRAQRKQRTPARCAGCGATYRQGHWTWGRLTPPAPATMVCPACRRTREHVPAGEITLGGGFFGQHADEILRLVQHVAKAENARHPLHRIMTIRRTSDTANVATTDIHLPRRIGHALESAWKGSLNTHYDEAGYFVRVSWERND